MAKVVCPVCGTNNWSGNEYCQKCSGALYGENKHEDESVYTLRLSNLYRI